MSLNESSSVASRLVAATLAGAMGAGCAAHVGGSVAADLDGLDADEGADASDADLRHAGFIPLGNDVSNVQCQISEDRSNAVCEAPMGEDVKIGVQCPARWEVFETLLSADEDYGKRRLRVAPGSRGRHVLLSRVTDSDGKEDPVFCKRAGTADSIRLALQTRPRDPDQPWVQVKPVRDHGEWVGDAGVAVAAVELPSHGGTGGAALLDGGATWHHVDGATGRVASFAPRLGASVLLGGVPLDGVQIVNPKTPSEVIDDQTETHRLGVVAAGPGVVLTSAQRAVQLALSAEAGSNLIDTGTQGGFTALGRLGVNLRFGGRNDRLLNGSKTARRGGGVQVVGFGGVSSGRPFAGAGVGGRF